MTLLLILLLFIISFSNQLTQTNNQTQKKEIKLLSYSSK